MTYIIYVGENMYVIGYFNVRNKIVGQLNKEPIYVSKNMFKNFMKEEYDTIQKKGNRVHFIKDETEYIFTKINKIAQNNIEAEILA